MDCLAQVGQVLVESILQDRARNRFPAPTIHPCEIIGVSLEISGNAGRDSGEPQAPTRDPNTWFDCSRAIETNRRSIPHRSNHAWLDKAVILLQATREFKKMELEWSQ